MKSRHTDDARRRVLLAIDLSYQSYRASAAHPLLESRRVFTGGLFGFFTSFAKMVRETRATHVVICTDTKPYHRSAAYPEYKQLRRRAADPELLERHKTSLGLIRTCLEDSGLPPWSILGFESDDLIAHCVRRFRCRFDRIYAASNDSDLYQCLSAPNFALLGKDLVGIITADTLLRDKGLTPDQHMLMTAMTGTHNDVDGIPGVGEVRARAAIASPQLMRKLRDGWGQVIDRNLELIRLPHRELDPRTPMPRMGDFDPRALYRCLSFYDVTTTGAMLAAFEQLSRG